MLKQVVLLKRRPGMSMEQFIDYYENHHSKLAERAMPTARRYIRRYVTPATNPITGEVPELDFDVVMEIWWDSQADYDAAMERIGGDEGLHRLIYEDEERLFNSHDHRVFTVEEHESVMSTARPVPE